MSRSEEEIKLSKTAKDALEDYLERLQVEYLSWYQNAAKTAFTRWKKLQQGILILGFLTTLLAAISQGLPDNIRSAITYLLIIIPLITNYLLTINGKFRFGEVYALREEAIINFQYLLDIGKTQYSTAKSEEDYKKILEGLVTKVQELEKKQLRGWHSASNSTKGEK